MERKTLSCAIAAVLGAAAMPAFAVDPADSLGEIVVTAQRRSENIQDVPISIQALTAQTLTQLNVSTFDDYIKFLPNVTSASSGPGQNEVFMRGLSAGSQASQGSAATGLWPNVAIYLDNQSGQMPNRNLDVFAADLNRIEVLEGPQGTLFGSGAEAGVIRYLTNEPKLNTTEGSVRAGYGVTAHGDPNSTLETVLNLPLMTDKMAVRAVFYSDHRGGYIDNVPAKFTRKNTDIGMHYANYAATQNEDGSFSCPDGLPSTGWCVPPGSPSLSNATIAKRAINPVTYQGTRIELLTKFSDDWSLLLSQSYQHMQADGVFYQQPLSSDGDPLKPLEVTLFNNTFDKDRFESTAWTLNGKFGPISVVYTGGYLTRNVDQVGDYTNYSRGVYSDYYQCHGAEVGDGYSIDSKCYSPSSYWRTNERNEHQQHELRFSTPDDWRLRGIVGAFWEDNVLYDMTSWHYKTLPACTDTMNYGCLSTIGTVPGTTVRNPGIQPDDTSFNQDEGRETKQLAFFASFDYDIIPKTLTATVGTRFFRFSNKFTGSVGGSFGCYEQGAQPGGCPNYPTYSYNLDAQNLVDTESGWRSRANLTWHITPDVMVYYTYSQGFRPGGFNQNGLSAHATGPDGLPQYLIPRAYAPDRLVNNEIGWKTEFFNRRLQWNGAVYQEDWKDVQIAFFNPGLVGNLFYNTNGQNFVIKGLETSLIARPVTGLMLQAAASWNRSRQTNSPALINNNPDSANYGQPITQLCNTDPCTPVDNPFGPIGAPSANSPPIQVSLRARYDWSVSDGYTAFMQVATHHSGHSFTQAGANPNYAIGGAISSSRGRFENPAYSTVDAAIGIAKDQWTFSLNGENLANSHKSVFVSTGQFIVAQTPLRPRVISGTFTYSF
jgi:outer membrane receptor protein involved in Fe transport